MYSVLITQAGTSIGRFLAKGLAASGWHVCLYTQGDPDLGDRLEAEITAQGGSASHVKMTEKEGSLIDACGCRLEAVIIAPLALDSEVAQAKQRKMDLEHTRRFAAQTLSAGCVVKIDASSDVREACPWPTEKLAIELAPNVRVNMIELDSFTVSEGPQNMLLRSVRYLLNAKGVTGQALSIQIDHPVKSPNDVGQGAL